MTNKELERLYKESQKKHYTAMLLDVIGLVIFVIGFVTVLVCISNLLAS